MNRVAVECGGRRWQRCAVPVCGARRQSFTLTVAPPRTCGGGWRATGCGNACAGSVCPHCCAAEQRALPGDTAEYGLSDLKAEGAALPQPNASASSTAHAISSVCLPSSVHQTTDACQAPTECRSTRGDRRAEGMAATALLDTGPLRQVIWENTYRTEPEEVRRRQFSWAGCWPATATAATPPPLHAPTRRRPSGGSTACRPC